MKFRSLMFRELRLSKKGIILQFSLLFAWILLTWCLLLSLKSNDITVENMQDIVDNIIIMMALIGSMYLMLEENFKSDINSGWLNYSYTLPIKPSERTAARFICRFSVCAVSILLSLFNAWLLCRYADKEFGVNYIVWHIVMFMGMILISLPNDIFVLRARNSEDMKKMRTVSGMANVAILAVIFIAILKASGIDFEMLANGEAPVKLPVFTVKSLAWAVPLLIEAIAASFFASYTSLKSSYLSAAKSEKKNTDIKPQTELAPKAHEINGLLYKELKQNRPILIFAIIIPILLTAFPFCFSAIGAISGSVGVDKVFETATNFYIRALMFIIEFFIVSGLISEVFKGDDKKLWAYFIVSSPGGVKGFLYRKYVITLMIGFIYMASGFFADNLLATVYYFVTGNALTASMQPLYISGIFMIMGVSALDIPFTLRYGSKKGSIIKMTVMLLLCAAVTAVFALLPDNSRSALIEAFIAIMNGENTNEILMLILSIIPYILSAAFLFSYKVSSRVFMKGVNEYDK